MSSKTTHITTAKEQESISDKAREKTTEHDQSHLSSRKITLHKSYSQQSQLPSIILRSSRKSNVKRKIYSQFKENIDIIREEANEIKSSLNLINTKCRNFSHPPINQTIQPTHLNSQSRLTSFIDSSSTSNLSPRTSSKRRQREEEPYRMRNFNVSPLSKQKARELYPQLDIIKYSRITVESIEFQMKYINDELSLILENYDYLKRKYIVNHSILKLFSFIGIPTQKKINAVIEETCGLALEVPYYILGVFYNRVSDFTGKSPFNVDDLNKAKVKSEAKCFIDNARIMEKAMSFLKACHELYQSLFPEVTSQELLIAYAKFNVIRGYFSRLRYNINDVMQIAETQLRNHAKDQIAVEEFEEEIGSRAKRYKRKEGDLINNIISSLVLRPSIESARIDRINKVLNLSKSRNRDERRRKIIKADNRNSLIRSPLIKSMFKYFDKDMQNKILAIKAHLK